MTKAWAKFWKFGCAGCAGLSLLCGGGVLMWLRAPIAAAAEALPRAREEAHRAGVTTEASDLEPNPPVSAADNAAPLLQRAVQMEHKLQGTDRRRSRLLEDYLLGRVLPAEAGEAKAVVVKAQPLIATLERAASKPRVDFKRDWRRGFLLTFPEYGSFRNFMRLLCVRALLRSAKGDVTGAYGDLETAGKLARLLAEERILIAQLTGLAANTIIYRTLQDVLRKHPDEAGTALAERTASHIGLPHSIRFYLGGESAGQVQTIRSANSLRALQGRSPSDNPLEKAADSLANQPIVREAVETRVLKAWTKTFLRLPRDDGDFAAYRQALLDTQREVESDHSPVGTFVEMLFPAFASYTVSVAEDTARHRLTLLAARLLAMRVKSGKLPDSLPNLGVLSSDPFGGKPFRYKRKSDGFVLYSIGPDLIDDGGKERAKGRMGQAPSYDIVVRFP